MSTLLSVPGSSFLFNNKHNFVAEKVKPPSLGGLQHVRSAAVSFAVIFTGRIRFIYAAILAETYDTTIIAAHLA
jgi:hypothetical protein